MRETALGLPVQVSAAQSAWLAQRFLADAGHPIFRAGVATDRDLRPLDAAGRVVYANVAVVGAAIAGFDPLREGCLEGVAVATGFAAGQH